MAITNFSKIKIGQTFVVDGEMYKKHDELTYNDAYGLQRYIDPLFDAKIGNSGITAKQVDVSAKIIKGDEEPKPEKKSKKSAKKGK